MFNQPTENVRIGIYGSDVAVAGKNVGLWASGYAGAVVAAGANPVLLEQNKGDRSWGEVLSGLQGVVLAGFQNSTTQGDGESLCQWAKRYHFPILAIDRGLLAMNSAFGGLNYNELSRELPEALQHRHPPEPGLRHAILVQPETMLCDLYGEGEIVVNSEHRQAIQRVANGFRICANALDGVIEGIEWVKNETWFALGIQWQPASASASGLDIQVFRGLIDACAAPKTLKKPQRLAMAG